MIGLSNADDVMDRWGVSLNDIHSQKCDAHVLSYLSAGRKAVSLRAGHRRKPLDWRDEQKHFERDIFYRHNSSGSFIHSIRNSVGRRKFSESVPRVKTSLLDGSPGPLSVSSSEVRKQRAYVEANRALRRTDETLTIHDLRLSWDDRELCQWAGRKARECNDVARLAPMPGWMLREEVQRYGMDWPQYDLFGLEGAINRVCDERWWRRQVRVLKVRRIDELARSFHMVHAHAHAYCGSETVRLRRAQARRNRSVLEGMEAVNNEGDSYTLAELSDLSVSNPELRRNELMVRMSGFEKVADYLRHDGLFITLNCPSRFHPMRQIFNAKGKLVRVVPNKNYDGSTVREAQDWLCKTWALVRSEMGRECVRVYGFRVVEPHQDGCPHWHMLLFAPCGSLVKLGHIIKAHALRTDAKEAGASEYRVKIVPIDKGRGTATGYIAKYICKNIDGSHIDEDLLGNAGADAAEKICAWASAHGIRQFQQIGGPSVTAWRELRRIKGEEGEAGVLVEKLARAADESSWCAFCLLMGGPFVRRDDQPLRAAYWLEFDAETGEEIDSPVNQYGEQSKGRLFGLRIVDTGKHLLTRFYTWTVQRITSAVEVVKDAAKHAADDLDEIAQDFLRGAGAPQPA